MGNRMFLSSKFWINMQAYCFIIELNVIYNIATDVLFQTRKKNCFKAKFYDATC